METFKTEENLDDAQSCTARKDWIERHNLQIRDIPEMISEEGRGTREEFKRASKEDLRGSRNLLRVPCTSISTLTGLSVGSRVVRPCQAVRTASSGRDGATHRTTPSMLLQHGYDWISAQDQRILTIMAMRREAQMEEEDLLLTATNLWEKNRIQYNQMMNEKRKQWNEYVQERRRTEKMELELRKENAEVSFQRHIADLERRINDRHSRCEQRQIQIRIQKKLPCGDVDVDTLSHRLRREEIQQEDMVRSAIHVGEILAKERRAQENLNALICYRDRTLKERRSKRERKIQAARDLREALNAQFQVWCEENQRLLSSRLCDSELRAAKAVEWRRKLTHETNQIKMMQHSYAMALLDEEERSRGLRARQELLKKENRIRNVRDRKEQAMLRSRMNALTTATLRQRIQSSYPLH